ncbi:thiopeptide-type bacteriocin biosynthesis protein [uncultured Tenacibaculum sp.]|uniref:thiopeptide-type bacteriocin biosynthesis protein n=1 Tax=uncultured Tenacibaculum sp. TaxID=174713 RepID=UPI00261AB016|nr:thiopeptide-type bacteriocin biosynthesis protein [uncultured Tenacibaculum sp.]
MKKNNWLSYYIYTELSLDKIIVELIKPTLEELENKKLLKSYFFIRYWENGPHIRLRVLSYSSEDNSVIETTVNKKVESYFSKQKDEYSLESNNYIREIDRYGGEQAIIISEKQFQDSSKIVLELLNDNFNKWNYTTAISFAIQMHLIFAKNVIKDIDKSIAFFESILNNWIQYSIKKDDQGKITDNEMKKVLTFFNNSYISQEKVLTYISDTIWNDNEKSEWIDTWKLLSKELRGLTIESIENIKTPSWFKLNKDGKLSVEDQKIFSIYDSYIHMTNNRLGVHLRDEAFIAFLIVKGLKSV